MPDDRVVSTLAERLDEIRVRVFVSNFDDAPGLLAAVEAALAKADEWEASSANRALVTREYAAECFRAAIAAALPVSTTGEDREPLDSLPEDSR